MPYRLEWTMNIEEEIRERFGQGNTPADLVRQGYRKSTVYKVYGKVNAEWFPIREQQWKIIGINFGKTRYQPGDNGFVSFTFENSSQQDFYLTRIGIQSEWDRLNQKWFAQEVNELVKPRNKRFFSINFQIPKNLPLDEYAIWFGVEGQYLPVTEYQPQITTSWSDPPIILDIKQPMTNIKLFISHSTQDMNLIQELEKRLDLNGIQTIIAENLISPGANIEQKIYDQIRASTVLLAIFTDNAARSEMVIKEINYASTIKKPLLLLKEKNTEIKSSLEWVEFSNNDPPDELLRKIMESLRVMESQGQISNPWAGIIGLGILALLAGIISGSGDE